MSSVILWSSVDNDTNSEDKFKEIATWWAELEGKSVEYHHVSGVLITPSTGEEKVLRIGGKESFTIQNPRLEDSNLCFEKQGCVLKILVQRLELDIEQKQLRVFSSDAHRFIFTQLPAPGAGFLRREKLCSS
jgi:hypothetical protein